MFIAGGGSGLTGLGNELAIVPSAVAERASIAIIAVAMNFIVVPQENGSSRDSGLRLV